MSGAFSSCVLKLWRQWAKEVKPSGVASPGKAANFTRDLGDLPVSLLSLTAGAGQRLTFLPIRWLEQTPYLVIPPISLGSCQIWIPKSWGLCVPCVPPSPLNGHRAAEPGTRASSRRPLSSPHPPSVPHRQRTRSHSPGRVPRSLTHLPSALQRAMSRPHFIPPGPPPALPHPVTSPPALSQATKPTPSAKPTRCTAANIDWGCSFPGPPPAGKTSREPSAEVCRPNGVPASGVQGARAQGPL